MLSATAYSATRWPVPVAYPSGPGGDHVQMRRAPLRLRRTVTGQSGRCDVLPKRCSAGVSQSPQHDPAAFGRQCLSASSAVAPVPPPTQGRCAPMAWQPAPLLWFRVGRWPQSVGKAKYRHTNAHGVGSLAHRAGRSAVVFVALVALARYGHRLRRPSGLHRVLFCEVVASHCAKAPFGVAYRWRALSGLQNPPYAKSLRWWLRSADAVASVRRCAHCLVSGLRPVITS